MRLFIWKDMESLRRYGTGKVIAYAPDVVQARMLAISIFTAEQKDLFGLEEFYAERVAAFKKEIRSKTPEVFTTLAALVEWGSE